MIELDPIDKLNLQIGFETWAESEGFAIETVDGDSGYVDSRTLDAWRGYLAAHTENGPFVAGQQLYAKIKKTSEYAHQSEKLFPVRVGAEPYDDYAVRGGPGGVYRIRDVDFYVIENGRQYRLK